MNKLTKNLILALKSVPEWDEYCGMFDGDVGCGNDEYPLCMICRILRQDKIGIAIAALEKIKDIQSTFPDGDCYQTACKTLVILKGQYKCLE